MIKEVILLELLFFQMRTNFLESAVLLINFGQFVVRQGLVVVAIAFLEKRSKLYSIKLEP